jgi:hypothetical protein
MFPALSRLFSLGMTKLWLFIGGIAAAATIYMRGAASAKQAERDRQEARRMAEHAESLGHRADTLKTAQDTRDEIDRLPDDAATRRLHDRWSRPDL